MCALAGDNLGRNLANDFKLPSRAERQRLLVNNPDASAKYAYAVMNAFTECLLGVRPGGGLNGLGVFGDIEAFHFNSEEQRSALCLAACRN